MNSYKVRVLDEAGLLVVGATLQCSDDVSARRRFERLPLPLGRAELHRGARLVATRVVAPVSATGRGYAGQQDG